MNLKNFALLALVCWSVSACAGTPSKGGSESSADAGTVNAKGEQGPLETFMQGCKTELESYCKDVTPGEGRILACIYAHGDKISGRCEYAMFDSAAQLERAVAAFLMPSTSVAMTLRNIAPRLRPGKGGC